MLQLVKYCHTVFTYPVQNSSASSGSARMIVIVDDEQICQKAVRIDSESRSEARACFNSRTSMPPPLPKESVAAAKGFRVQLPRSQSHSMLHVACSVPCRMWQSHVACVLCTFLRIAFHYNISHPQARHDIEAWLNRQACAWLLHSMTCHVVCRFQILLQVSQGELFICMHVSKGDHAHMHNACLFVGVAHQSTVRASIGDCPQWFVAKCK